jgi:uncharacterized protein YbbC (DUF1343 family)
LYAGQRCGGVSIRVTNRQAVRSMRMGLEIAAILRKLYPAQFDVAKIFPLVGNEATINQLQGGDAPEHVVAGWSEGLTAFEKMRRKYFLYK